MGFSINLRKKEFQSNLIDASWKHLLTAALAVSKKAKEYAPKASLHLRKSIGIIEKDKTTLTVRVGSLLPYARYQHEETLGHLGQPRAPESILSRNLLPTKKIYKKRQEGDLKSLVRSSMSSAKYARNYRALKQSGELKKYKSEYLYLALEDTDVTGIMTEGIFGK